MNRKLFLYIVLIIYSVLSSSCNTYTNFYSNTFSAIPQNDHLEVYRLDLSNQNLEALPPSITLVKNLKMLNISGNTNLDLDQVFQKLSSQENIEILILDSLNISRFPESIKRFSNLKQLSLANNPNLDLEYTFDLISKLPIEFLNLKGNVIEKLPENMINLKSIKDLNLSFNKLRGKKNYELLGKLPNLYSLWLDHNELKIVPNTIGKVSQIRFLYLDHNQLEKLPIEMSNMKTWVIHAGYNNFKELPEVFTTMRSLFMVHLNNNDISIIPELYESEKYPLAGLILDNNPISETDRAKAEKLFKGFFLLSFEQK